MDEPAAPVRRDRGILRAVRVVAGVVAALGVWLTASALADGRILVRLGSLRLRTSDTVTVAAASAVACAVFLASVWPLSWLRRVAVVALTTVAVMGAILVGLSAGVPMPVGDGAVIELYTGLATAGRQFLGPYSRFIWHHPGPLYFYLAAPFYALSGHDPSGVQVAALAINVASAALIAWVLVRTAGARVLAIVLPLVAGTYLWRTADLLVSTWNPHVTLLPAMALVIVSAGTAAGDAWLLPVTALVATFLAQTHVGLVPFALALSAVALVGAVIATRSTGRWRRLTNFTAWTIAALWLLPLAEELTRTPGNLTRLWQFFMASRGGQQTWTDAGVAWAHSIASPWLPGLSAGWGVAFKPSGGAVALLTASALTMSTAAAAGWAAKTGRRFLASISGLSLLAFAVAFWSLRHIAGEIVDHEVFWLSVPGALAGSAVASAAIEAWRPDLAVPSWARHACALGLCAVTIVLGVRQLAHPSGFTFNQRVEATEVETLRDGIAAYLRGNGVRKPLFRMDYRTWAMTAGVVLELEKRGVPLAVEAAAVPIFSDAFATAGDEDAEITIAQGPRHLELASRPGNVLVANADRYFADAVRIEPNQNR